jgi:hypothetical protein
MPKTITPFLLDTVSGGKHRMLGRHASILTCGQIITAGLWPNHCRTHHRKSVLLSAMKVPLNAARDSTLLQ